MNKVGIATLPLHRSKAPYWLLKRMVKLGKPIFQIIYENEGSEGILRKLSDTFWFQGMACVLGFDWHSSGCTTVLGGVLKQILSPEQHRLIIAGGKGKNALLVKEHLLKNAKHLDFSEDNVSNLCNISRLVAKIDNAAVQDGFSLYHHLFIVSEKSWGVIQQGLDPNIKKARRYHWLSENLNNYLNDPHKFISSEVYKPQVLNMASKSSEDCRKVSLDLISEGSRRLKQYLLKLNNKNQKTLDDFLGIETKSKMKPIKHLKMPIPFNLKWETVDLAKQLSVNDYVELLKIKGFGPGMIRALALISELLWGTPPSWKDPAKYAYAVGGKDGIPYPVNLKRMERCASFLEQAINESKLNNFEKINALRRLTKFKQLTHNEN